MFIFKKLIFLIIFILINGCTLGDFKKKQNISSFSIEINTHKDRYNKYLKENLKIDYQLIDKNTNIIVKSGSINTFPALSSSSNSLYAQENSIDFIKERLTKSSAKSLYSRIKVILRRLI